MSEHADRTSADIIADTLLQKDQSVRKLYAAIPRWPLNISSIFAILFVLAFAPISMQTLGKYTQIISFIGFMFFLAVYVSNLHKKIDQIIIWIADQTNL